MKNNWEEKKLKHVSSIHKGRLPAETLDAPGKEDSAPYLSMNYLRNEDTSIVYVPLDQDLVLADTGDILLLWDGANAGEFLRAKKGVISSTIARIDPKGINREFLFWYCKALEAEVRSETVGMGIPHVNGDFLNNLTLRVPELSEQHAIADFLNQETIYLDTLISEKNRFLKLLSEKRNTLIDESIKHGLRDNISYQDSDLSLFGRIPTHWKSLHLKRILVLMDYGISEPVNKEGKIAILRMGDVNEREISFDNVGFVDAVDSKLLLSPGDLVFNRTNSLDQVGKVGIFRDYQTYPVSFASYLVRLRCAEIVLPEFLNYVLNCSLSLAWARSEALPSIGQANLNPTRYGYLPIALPPIAEQRDIISYLGLEMSKIDVLWKETEKTIILLKERRLALISAVVTGKLHIDEASRHAH